MIERCVIAGANGGFGRLMGRLLLAARTDVVGLDLGPEPSDPTACSRYLACDATRPGDVALKEIGQADLVILCLPEDVLYRVLGPVIAALPDGALLVDTTSVKTPYARELAGQAKRFEALSLNPMFAPDVGFPGQDVAAVRLRPGAKSLRFEALVETWGGRLVPLSPEDHDRQTAMTQVATHATILAYGLCLARLDYNPSTAITTPPQRALLGLFARIASLDPEVYWHIQRDNPFAIEARNAVREALAQIDQLVATSARAGFRDKIAEAAAKLDLVKRDP